METTLQKIANTLLINVQHAEKYGLLEGKTGIALFFYHYYRLTGNNTYLDFANELLNEISNSLYQTMSADFLEGLTGVAWGIRYLISQKFVDADADDILEEVDASLINVSYSEVLSDITVECPVCSKGIYFLIKKDKRAINNVLNILTQLLGKNDSVLPLSYYNSILYLILQESYRLEMINILYTNIIHSIDKKRYTLPDVLLLTCLVENFKQIKDVDFDCKKWEKALNLLEYRDSTGIYNMGISRLIFEKVNIDSYVGFKRLEAMDIESQINVMVDNAHRNLNLYNGLAGAGLTLIDYIQKRNETPASRSLQEMKRSS